MSTAATITAAALPDADARPTIGRLTTVELRKMANTRAGFWLLASTAGLTVAIAIVACLTFPDGDASLLNFFVIAIQPASILMPVVGILLVTSEWSQRTAMVTFALVPQRMRVMAAKLLAGLVLTAIAFAICLTAALAMTAIAGDAGEETWSLSAGLFAQIAISVVVPMLAGIAFGAVLLASAPAIVLYYILPTAWAALGAIPAVEGVAEWLDQTRTMERMLEETLSAGQWARVAASLALWLVLPLAIGLWRVARSDVR